MSRKRSSRVRIDVAFADDAGAPSGAAGRLFAVACPGCQAELAVTTDMAGGEACCPTCAAPFTVPEPRIADPVVPRWVTPAEPTAAPSFETPAAAPLAPTAAEPDPFPAHGGPSVNPASVSVPFEPLAPGTPVAAPAAAEMVAPASSPPAPAEVAHDTATPSTPAPEAPRGELDFREPVRSITVGDATIELRRLSPEEKLARRARRNMLILVVGAAILFALVLALGRR